VAELNNHDEIEVLIYHDAGFDPELETIASQFLPQARRLKMSDHLGASGINRRMIADFAADDRAAQLLVLDSDMIVRTDLVETIRSWPAREDMLVSVYNSGLHPALRPSAARFVHKYAMGSPGTVWSRAMAKLVADNVPDVVPAHGSYDLTYCAFLRERGIPLCCSNRSLVQHLGFRGTNNNTFGKIDYGLNYTPDGLAQFEAMADVLDDIMSNQGYYLGMPDRHRRLID
jgi:hypothetical protein